RPGCPLRTGQARPRAQIGNKPRSRRAQPPARHKPTAAARLPSLLLSAQRMDSCGAPVALEQKTGIRTAALNIRFGAVAGVARLYPKSINDTLGRDEDHDSPA